jgi:hypothetical protein
MRNFFIIGCGFTKSIFSDAPLNSELLDAIIANTIGDNSLNTLFAKYGDKDIEVLLTKYDLDEKLYQDLTRQKINEQLASFFVKYRFKSEVIVRHPWINNLSSLFYSNDIIVNLNYDCFLEGLLDYKNIWTPNGGYSFIQNDLADSLPTNPKGIKILKIHGSENFREAAFVDKPDSTHLSFEINPELFPVSAVNSHFGGGVNSTTYLIAPSYVKKPKAGIIYLMIEALVKVNEADNLIIIGCGLRSEDSFLWSLITNFMKTPRWKERKIYILDPNAENIRERIVNHWGVNIFTPKNMVTIPMDLQNGLQELLTKLANSTAN